MANTNRPFGLRPVRYLNGAPYNGQVTSYYVPSTDNTALFIGDPVTLVGTGNVAAFMEYPIGTLPTCTIATAGTTNLVVGSVVGVLPITRESTPYRAASVEQIVFVADDPNLIFQIQDDGGGTLAASTVGLNAVLIAGTGSTVTSYSAWALDGGTSSAPATTVGFQLKILGVSNLTGNDVTSDYAVWDVLINQHSFGKNVVGV